MSVSTRSSRRYSAPVIASLLLAACTGAEKNPSAQDDTSIETDSAWDGSFPEDCGSLPAATGVVVNVTPAEAGDLASIVASAAEGTTIQLAAGDYDFGRVDASTNLAFTTPGVTLRGVAGDAGAVVIDGAYAAVELATITANNVVLADLTLRRAVTNGVHIRGSATANTTGVVLYNVVLEDSLGAQVQIDASGENFADAGLIACSQVRFSDAARDAAAASCAPAGIAADLADGWHIRDNYVDGFWCETGTANPGIEFATNSADTLIERNVALDNTVGIAIGSSRFSGTTERPHDGGLCPDGSRVGHFGGVVRNNMVTAVRPELFAADALSTGIDYAEACEPTSFHNSVYILDKIFGCTKWRGKQTHVTSYNELLSCPPEPVDGSGDVVGEVSDATAEFFADLDAGDLHLAAGTSAENAGAAVPEGSITDDIDLQVRSSPADVGADER